MYVLRRATSFMRDFNRHKYYLARLGKKEKKFKTVYEDGVAYKMNVETGEIISKKRPKEVMASVHASLRRTEELCRSIVEANEWKYFVTLTFDGKKVNRHSDKAVLKLFEKWRRNIRRHYPGLIYWGAPERHKDNALHFHFLMTGVNDEQLGLVFSGKYKQNRPIFNVTKWKNGFSTLVKISGEDCQAKVQNYIMKYIRKSDDVMGRGKKRFWNSKNCARILTEIEQVPIFFYNSCDAGKNKDLLMANNISVYDIAIRDVPTSEMTTVVYADFQKNFCVIHDRGKPKPRIFKSLFPDGKVTIL